MELTEPPESVTPQSRPVSDTAGNVNGRDIDESVLDDTRSSSLSDIDDSLDNDQLDDESPKPEKFASEIDSEAETERIDDSPNHPRNRASIVLSAGAFETSPSKLAQSTTYDELNDEEGDETEASPSKPQRQANSNGIAPPDDVATADGSELLSASLEAINKKRKRLALEEDTGAEPSEDEPLRKRRGSVPVDGTASKSLPDLSLTLASGDTSQKNGEASTDETPAADETQSLDARISGLKGKRGKKGKRKGRAARSLYDDQERESATPAGDQDLNGVADEQPGEDEEHVEGVVEAEDAEAISKAEEEIMKKSTAMDLLISLERQFATLRDRIYDERIANLNSELAQLNEENPTHPEFLRQLGIIEQYRDDKIKYEKALYEYKLSSLVNKSLADRCQTNSSYFQHARDVREKFLDEASEHHYRIQQDRFQNTEASPDFSIPFPIRRSQQVAQQTAYNKEVSVLSGYAKFVGFPAAPALRGVRQHEVEDDFLKMGIGPRPQNPPAPTFSQPLFPRSALASSSLLRPAAAEEFLEQTPWANPQHSTHEQYLQQLQQSRLAEQQRTENPFSTPAAQQRIVDLSAPNGSASTIPEHPSAPNSSAANTPQVPDQDRALQSQRLHTTATDSPYSRHPEADEADRNSGYHSLASSPLDVRKPSNARRPQARNTPGRRSPAPPSSEGPATRDNPQSPPTSSARLGRFGAPPRREPSPQLPPSNPDLLSSSSARQRSTPLSSMHQAAGITAGGSGRSRMGAR
ncbi:hypothetical protein FQN55_002977 [Onygenales sp. PD_40]|nr:hypothetical protein FQN55_002977 [Onygenales sp. PD_40]KAK2775275.1 hypothetical protein FQN53_003255 [Emmonsiellopsis sp. PD_33]KAK2804869.1 hypothetical protein FQN51_001511 [Onygenales sp. PD_10]